MVYFIPNPKTGHDVKVTFTHKGDRDMTRSIWFAYAVDVRGKKFGYAHGELRANTTATHAFLNTSAGATPKGKGYGLCLYLAAAIFAKDAEHKKGLASFERTNDSTRFWEKLCEAGLAECRDENGSCKLALHTFCTLDSDVVLSALKRYGWRR